jgi:hypothetical protein
MLHTYEPSIHSHHHKGLMLQDVAIMPPILNTCCLFYTLLMGSLSSISQPSGTYTLGSVQLFFYFSVHKKCWVTLTMKVRPIGNLIQGYHLIISGNAFLWERWGFELQPSSLLGRPFNTWTISSVLSAHYFLTRNAISPFLNKHS